ncbi:5'-flap endonuclease [Rhizina undulata]
MAHTVPRSTREFVTLSSSPASPPRARTPTPTTPKLSRFDEIPGTPSPYLPSPSELLEELCAAATGANGGVERNHCRNRGMGTEATESGEQNYGRSGGIGTGSIWDVPEDPPQSPSPAPAKKNSRQKTAVSESPTKLPSKTRGKKTHPEPPESGTLAESKALTDPLPSKQRTKKSPAEPSLPAPVPATGAQKPRTTRRQPTIKTGTKSHYFGSPSSGLTNVSLADLPPAKRAGRKKKPETVANSEVKEPRKRGSRKKEDATMIEGTEGDVVEKPKRPRGRPKKVVPAGIAVKSEEKRTDVVDSAAANLGVSKSDSVEESLAPKRPRGRPKRVASAPLTLESPVKDPNVSTPVSIKLEETSKSVPVEETPGSKLPCGLPQTESPNTSTPPRKSSKSLDTQPKASKSPSTATEKHSDELKNSLPLEPLASETQLPEKEDGDDQPAPKPKPDVIVIATSSSPEDTLPGSSPVEPGEKEFDFAGLIEGMRYSENTKPGGATRRSISTGVDEKNQGPLVKKRCIEILDRPTSMSMPPPPPPTKKKVAPKPKPPKESKFRQPKPQREPKFRQPKKKPLTITGKATEQFREAPVSPVPVSPIKSYFPPEPSPSTASTSTKLKKVIRKTRAKQKEEEVVEPLLSPGSARARFDAQTIIFGTFSQLEGGELMEGEMKEGEKAEVAAKEEEEEEEEVAVMEDGLPPSTNLVRRNFLGTLSKTRKRGSKAVRSRLGRYQTFEAFEREEDEVTPVVKENDKDTRKTGMLESRLKKRSKGAGLWSAASRDFTGGLLDVEVLDMTASPAVSVRKIESHTPSTMMSTGDDDGFHYIPDSPIQTQRPPVSPSGGAPEFLRDSKAAMEEEEVEVYVRNSPILTSKPTNTKIPEDEEFNIIPESPIDSFHAYFPDSPIPASPPTNTKITEYEEFHVIPESPVELCQAYVPDSPIPASPPPGNSQMDDDRFDFIPNSPLKPYQPPPSPPPAKSRKRTSLEAAFDPPSASQSELVPVSSQPGRKSKKRKSVSPSRAIGSKGKKTEKEKEKEKKGRPRKVEEKAMPDYNSWVKTKLEVEIQKFGFRKMKSREDMVDVLVKCWRAQHAPSSSVPASKIPAFNISAPPATAPAAAEASAQKTKATMEEKKETMRNITKAVKHDKDMWEKLLRYEPVVVDEFCGWLNVRGLGAVGVDEEVGAEVVREWCEAGGVCCVLDLWKHGK